MRIANGHGLSWHPFLYYGRLEIVKIMDQPSQKLLKKKLRAQAHKQRLQIRPATDSIDNIIKRLAPFLDEKENADIAVYWPINGELDLTLLIDHYGDSGHRFCLPRVAPDTLMLDFAVWDKNTKFEEGAFGIYEPVIHSNADKIHPEIFLVPLLAFDRQGTRLGYGGGYYDKTLAKYRQEKDIISIGVAYDEQICLFPLPKEEHDVALDYIITPTMTYNFIKD